MDVGLLLEQLESWSEFIAKLGRIIPADFQATTFLRTIQRERANDQMASSANRPGCQFDIFPAVFGVGQKVKDSPVVPQLELAEITYLRDVRNDP